MVYFVAAVLLISFSSPAHAYLDAGSGSYMLQFALAGFMGVVFALKLFWQKMKDVSNRLFSGHGNGTTQNPT